MLDALLERVILSLLGIVASLISLVIEVVKTMLFSQHPTSKEVQHQHHKRNKRKRGRFVSKGRKSSQKR